LSKTLESTSDFIYDSADGSQVRRFHCKFRQAATPEQFRHHKGPALKSTDFQDVGNVVHIEPLQDLKDLGIGLIALLVESQNAR